MSKPAPQRPLRYRRESLPGNYPRTAIVRGPGGLPGIECHVGAIIALEEAGIRPDWVSGCSAGAIVSACQAAGWTGQGLKSILLDTDDAWLVQRYHVWRLRSILTGTLARPDHLTAKLAELLPERFDELRIPFEAAVTRMGAWRGAGRIMRQGKFLRQAVRASSCIHGVWPPVAIGHERYTDGGTTLPYPIPAVSAEFDRVIIVDITYDDYPKRDSNLVAKLLWNYEQTSASYRLHLETDIRRKPKIHWIRLHAGDQSCLKFSPGGALIDSAAEQTRRYLDENDLRSQTITTGVSS